MFPLRGSTWWKAGLILGGQREIDEDCCVNWMVQLFRFYFVKNFGGFLRIIKAVALIVENLENWKICFKKLSLIILPPRENHTVNMLGCFLSTFFLVRGLKRGEKDLGRDVYVLVRGEIIWSRMYWAKNGEKKKRENETVWHAHRLRESGKGKKRCVCLGLGLATGQKKASKGRRVWQNCGQLK